MILLLKEFQVNAKNERIILNIPPDENGVPTFIKSEDRYIKLLFKFISYINHTRKT